MSEPWFVPLVKANELTSKRQVADIVKPELLTLLLHQERYDEAEGLLDRWVDRIDFELGERPCPICGYRRVCARCREASGK